MMNVSIDNHVQKDSGNMICAFLTQRPPLLLCVVFGNLFHFNRIVDNKVHELVKSLFPW